MTHDTTRTQTYVRHITTNDECHVLLKLSIFQCMRIFVDRQPVFFVFSRLLRRSLQSILQETVSILFSRVVTGPLANVNEHSYTAVPIRLVGQLCSRISEDR